MGDRVVTETAAEEGAGGKGTVGEVVVQLESVEEKGDWLLFARSMKVHEGHVVCHYHDDYFTDALSFKTTARV